VLATETCVGGWAKVYRKGRKFTYRRLSIEAMKPNYETPFWNKQKAPGQIVKCFDEETEVLTDQGFERFAVAEGRILQVTTQGLKLTDSVPFFQEYTSQMVEWKSRNGNFCVTPNHDLPLSIDGGEEDKIEANYLLTLKNGRSVLMPMTVTGSGVDVSISDAEIQLAAAYLADGSDNSAGSGFCIAVSRKDKIKRLNDLGLYRSVSDKKDGGKTATLSSGRVITTKSDKRAFYYSRTSGFSKIVERKKLVNNVTIISLSMRQARLMLDTWMDFDGNRPSNLRCGRIYTSRRDHFSSLELLAVAAGYSVSQRNTRKTEGGKDNYWMTITDRTTVNLIPASIRSVKNNSKGVWCVTVPSGKIVVRRHGFSAVCHQCAEADALRSTFPTLMGGLHVEGEIIDITPSNAVQVETTSRLVAMTSEPVEREQPHAPEPEKGEPEKQEGKTDLTPQQQLANLVSNAGNTFDQFKVFVKEEYPAVQIDAIAGFDDLRVQDAKNFLRAKEGMLAWLKEKA
jgi:hypothetical protein